MKLLPQPNLLRYWNYWKQENCSELIEKEYQREIRKRAQEMTDKFYGFSPLPEEYYKDYNKLL